MIGDFTGTPASGGSLSFCGGFWRFLGFMEIVADILEGGCRTLLLAIVSGLFPEAILKDLCDRKINILCALCHNSSERLQGLP